MGTLTRKKHPDRDYPQNPHEYGHAHAHAHNLYKKPNFKENIIIKPKKQHVRVLFGCVCAYHMEREGLEDGRGGGGSGS